MTTLTDPMRFALAAISRGEYDEQRAASNTRRALARRGLIELRGNGSADWVLTAEGRRWLDMIEHVDLRLRP